MIFYIGNFRPWWSTETHVALSLEELGHRVIRLQEDTQTAEQVLAQAKYLQPDMLLWTRTWGLQGDGRRMLNEIGIPSAAFHLDLYAGLQRNGNVEVDPWWHCDYVFSADGGSDEFWKAHNINHRWSPPAVYGKECYFAEKDATLEQDVIFAGSYGYHPEWPYRHELIDKLKERYGHRFTLYEHGSPGAPWRGDKLNRLYASARIVVGDSLCLNFKHRNYWSDRIPETLGRGGFLIHPWIGGMENHFEADKHFAIYQWGNWDDLFGKIDYYLDHPIERERIRLAGHEHVKAKHTYVHRMQRLLDIVGATNFGSTADLVKEEVTA